MRQPIRVLVVEDHPVYAKALKGLLEMEGDMLVTGIADSVATAVALASLTEPDVVLMDHTLMGPGTGTEATIQILHVRPSTAVVLVTGTASHDDLLAAAEAGIRGYVPKTAGVDEVVDAVRRASANLPLASAPILATLLREAIAKREAMAGAASAAQDDKVLLDELVDALETGAITLEYQPKVNIRTASVYALEGLARWTHPARGSIPPSQFIPLAEAGGLISRLTRHVLLLALRQRRSLDGIDSSVRMSINISTRDLTSPGFADFVVSALEDTRTAPGSLILEITETDVMTQPETARVTLQLLRAHGVEIAIDDFGTGYSSLAYLHTLPVTCIKVDRSFVARMAKDQAAGAIVRSMIDLGHSLGLVVVAEGVEDRDTFDALVTAGCDAVQGYLICRPLPPERLQLWLRDSGWASHETPSLETSAPRTATTGDGRVVLLVDDNKLSLRGTSRTLTDAGFIVHTASSSSMALELSRELNGQIHLLIADFVMPGMNGAELIDAVRSQRPDTRFILTSGFPRGLIDLASTGKESSFLAKPFTERALLERVAGALDPSRGLTPGTLDGLMLRTAR